MRTNARTAIRTPFALLVSLAVLSVAALPALATINPSADATNMTDGAVRVVMRDGPWIYIGGQFTKVRTTPIGVPGPSFLAAGIARVDAVTGNGDPTWTPDVTWGSYVTTAPPTVWALAAAGGKIWIGGDFGAVDGLPRTNFAAVDALTGIVDPNVTAAVGVLGAQSVRAMTASSSRVYVGGVFTAVDGIARKHLAAFGLGGTVDTMWAPKTDKRVLSMAWDCTGSTLFVGGQFRRVASPGQAWQPRETIAKLDPTSGTLLGWAIPTGTIELDQKAYALAPSCTQLNVGYGRRNYAAAFSLTSGDVGTRLWRVSTSGNVQAITNVGNQVVIGGHFTSVAGVTRLRIAALAASNGALDPNWSPALEGQWGGPWSLLASDNHLYVGGQFTTVAGVGQNFFARFTFS